MVEVLRETKNAINARLDMLEMMIIKSNNINKEYNNDNNLDTFIKDTNNRFEEIETVFYRFNEKINSINNYIENQQTTDILPRTIIIDKEDNNLSQTNEAVFDISIPNMIILNNDVEEVAEEEVAEEEIAEEEIAEEEVAEEEVAEEEVAEEEVAEEEVAEEEVAEEEVSEEENIELTEFEYKGMTLYHDNDMKVYRMDEEGALSDVMGIYHPHPTKRELDKIKKV